MNYQLNPTRYMNFIKSLLLIGIATSCFYLSCSETKTEYNNSDNPFSPKIKHLFVGEHFGSDSLNCHFSLFDKNANEYLIYNEEVFNQKFPPASTFKIFNTLMAIETGVISDTSEVYNWDGIDRGWVHWNKDHTISSAIKFSALWFFQKVAAKVHEKDSTLYLRYIQKSNYGDLNILKRPTYFWFDGSLNISPKEQINFLHNLQTETLPFAIESIKSTKNLILIKSIGDNMLYGKTGLAKVGEKYIGWYVGYVEKGKSVYFFCTNIQKQKNVLTAGEIRSYYIKVTHKILSSLDIFDPEINSK